MSEYQPHKNYFGLELAHKLAGRIVAVQPTFPAEQFVAQIAARVDELELKDRVALIAAALRECLPADYPAALQILLSILGPENPKEEGMFTYGYHLMPVAYFVEVYGLDHFDHSITALAEVTKRHTAEYAIRPYLGRYPQQTLAVLEGWAVHANAHVRRLVSEGTRPRLPWATRLTAFVDDPGPVLRLLEKLKHDPSPYVRKSVANNLNDIAKDHPDLVLETLSRWSQHAGEETRWITRHALRNLVKQGHPAALKLLGFNQIQVSLQQLKIEPETVRLGDSLKISFTLQNETPESQYLVVDYIIHLAKANGKTSPKVFKLRTQTLNGGERLTLQKSHSFKPVRTRRYYGGQQRLEVQVNGVVVGGENFRLMV